MIPDTSSDDVCTTALTAAFSAYVDAATGTSRPFRCRYRMFVATPPRPAGVIRFVNELARLSSIVWMRSRRTGEEPWSWIDADT